MTHPHIIGMQFFLLLDPWIIRIARGYNRHPRITNTHAPYWFRHCCTRFTQTLFAVSMQSMWVTYALQKQHGLILISHRTALAVCSSQLFTTNTTFIHYFDFKSKHGYWKSFFSIVIFYQSTVSQSFIDVSKCKKYKQCINQCIYF